MAAEDPSMLDISLCDGNGGQMAASGQLTPTRSPTDGPRDTVNTHANAAAPFAAVRNPLFEGDASEQPTLVTSFQRVGQDRLGWSRMGQGGVGQGW